MVTATPKCEADGMCSRAPFLWVTLVAGALASGPSCNSPLKGRRDAGTNLDAGARPDGESRPDVAVPDAAVPETALPDAGRSDVALDATPEAHTADVAVDRGSTTDQGVPPGVPAGFRIVNHTDETYYFNVTANISCTKVTSQGDEACYFFHDWAPYDCTSIPADGNCCVLPERAVPSMLPIPAGQDRFIPWPGVVYGRTAGACAQCQCQQPLPEQQGDYTASIQVSGSYTCWVATGCQTATDGSITGALPQGDSRAVQAAFTDPSIDAEVVFSIGSLARADAGPADLGPLDGRTSDLLSYDRGPDGVLAGFPEIPGTTFAIAASASAPDASASGSACRPSDMSAVYQLQFSADGQKVHIIRTDSVQEVMMDGVLTEPVAGSLVYEIDNNWAGAQLVVRRDGTTLAAQLVIFGSGVPVVSCIDAPMTFPVSKPELLQQDLLGL